MLKHYWQVIKPGIIAGNLVSFLGGFFLASRGQPNIVLLLTTATGLSLVIASACVLNNCADRDIDRRMQRTRNRVLARGLMSPWTAIVYASVLGLTGAALLLATGRLLPFMLAMAGFAVYAGAYSLYLKRHSVHATLIGSLSGAAPPLVGYCAANGRFDLGALILLLIFALWQIPHFYAIAIYRLEDYRAAAIPVLPAKRDVATTKRHMVCYMFAFVAATLMLRYSEYAGDIYLAMIAATGLGWLLLAWKGYSGEDDRVWARKIFVYSLVAVMVLSGAMSVDPVTPGTGMTGLHQYLVWNHP